MTDRNRVLETCARQVSSSDSEMLGPDAFRWLEMFGYRTHDYHNPGVRESRTGAARQILARLIIWIRRPGACPEIARRGFDGVDVIHLKHDFKPYLATASPEVPSIWECRHCHQEARFAIHPLDREGPWLHRRAALRLAPWEFLHQVVGGMSRKEWGGVHDRTTVPFLMNPVIHEELVRVVLGSGPAVFWAEQHPDVYSGERCDEHRPRWRAFAHGDKMEECSDAVVRLDPRHHPPGSHVIITEPSCPDCGDGAGLAWSYERGEWSTGRCKCGFDWHAWTEERYS